jgi:hypothetical protein
MTTDPYYGYGLRDFKDTRIKIPRYAFKVKELENPAHS